MWRYVKRYLHFAIIAALFMVGEVLMDLVQPGMMSRVIDEGVLGIGNQGIGNMQVIWRLGLTMIGLVIIGGLCGSLNNVFSHFSAQNIGNDIRKDCFQHIMRFSFSQIDQMKTGSLVTRVTNDITQLQNFVSVFVRGMIRTFMLMFGSLFFMFRLNNQFGLIVLCAFPFILGCMIFCLWKASPWLPQVQEQIDLMNDLMQEDITGIRMIKACVKEVYEKRRFQKANDELMRTQLKVLVLFAFMNPTINALMYCVVVLIFMSGSSLVLGGTATPGTIMAAITYTTQLLNGILMLVLLFQNITKGIISWKRVKEVLFSEPDLKEGSFDGETNVQGKIEFQDVSFAFPGTHQMVLKHINLQIYPGETIAIMGSTGCGKSALVSLIPRFYDVSEGRILIDGQNVKDYQQKALREKISIALQKTELFSMSIQDNITWGKINASLEDIQQAAKIAQADEFIKATPNGYETLVAERGMSLSGGQKQRLSIARAVIKPSEILIFDDATSALDLKTEAALYRHLNQAKSECTKIMIAQRIASVRQADRIVILNNGQIEAVGSHEELMKISVTYQDIYHSQMGSEGENDE